MHIAFVDITYGYTADRPDTDKPVGGTTSAICFMARELVKVGITCTFFNKIEAPATACGITSLPLAALAEAHSDPAYTAFVFCGRWLEGMVRLIRAGTRAPLIAWMHESTFNNQLVPALDVFDGVMYVSAWQQRINQVHAFPHWKQAVIRSGMNPHFTTLFGAGESILAAKTRPPVLLYVGTFPRGAFHIPPLLDKLRLLRTDFTMEVFCNTNPSGHAESDAKYIAWMRSLPNITHVGQVERRDYAPCMKRAAFLVSPNPWPETSCVSLIEAMAAGLSIITTDRAVLPETAAGFARHIPIPDPDHPLRFDAPVPYDAFAQAVSDAMDEWLKQPEKTEAKLRAQVDYALAHYRWPLHVGAWINYLRSFG